MCVYLIGCFIILTFLNLKMLEFAFNQIFGVGSVYEIRLHYLRGHYTGSRVGSRATIFWVRLSGMGEGGFLWNKSTRSGAQGL